MEQVSIKHNVFIIQLRHSEKARRNYELQRTRAKRQINYQQGRNPQSDGFEFDSACDPRHAAFLRNKRAQEFAANAPKENQSNEGSNNISPFIRIQKATV